MCSASQTSVQQTETAEMLGAHLNGNTAEFRVWAPYCESVTVKFENGREFQLTGSSNALFSGSTAARAGDRYFLIPRSTRNPGNLAVPDPVSRLLPEGLHGPTEIVDPDAFQWTDQRWRGLPLDEYILYEVHTGTFTPEGTFEAIISKFDYLQRLGVTALEIMPVAAFPGTRGWGYDGASHYAVHARYGGPDGLKKLVNAAHERGLAVVLDVVYNHFGPEGNYVGLFGPYFTDHHKTPWGDGINFDDEGCEHVRRHFVENALYWIREYHFDGLRLDAVQTIKDASPRHIVREIAEKVHALSKELGRTVCVTAETDENEPRYLLSRQHGGYGLDAVWSDDFHHALHTLLTGEKKGYYRDFGDRRQLVRALNEGFAFQGEHFAYWGRPRGSSAANVPLPAHIICTQNHDQIGNRAQGERLTQLVPRGAAKLASALLLLSPSTPLLFMGQEFGETAPFQFFTDFEDPNLRKAVSEGRRGEFAEFDWTEVPDPQDPETFERSRLHWELAHPDNDMLRWYCSLIEIRKKYIIPNQRTAMARTREDAIVMRSPRPNPVLMVVAEWPGSIPFEDQACWTRILQNEEDDYRVRVFMTEPGWCNPAGDLD
jgi:maltooligosyltrehalose trehalohydrolase